MPYPARYVFKATNVGKPDLALPQLLRKAYILGRMRCVVLSRIDLLSISRVNQIILFPNGELLKLL